MKRILLMCAAALAFLSCEKTPEPKKESPVLGEEFEEFESLIDLSQQNKYDETLLCKTWVLEKGISELYVDGHLESTTDITEQVSLKSFTYNDDHTMSFFVEDYPSVDGKWLYAHNFVMIKYGAIGQIVYEVTDLTDNTLHLRSENVLLAEKLPFFRNPAGRHTLNTLVLKAE